MVLVTESLNTQVRDRSQTLVGGQYFFIDEGKDLQDQLHKIQHCLPIVISKTSDIRKQLVRMLNVREKMNSPMRHFVSSEAIVENNNNILFMIRTLDECLASVIV